MWTGCGDEDNTFVVLAAASDPVDHVVLVYFLAVDDPDYEAFDVLARTFYVETAGTADLIATTADSRPNRARANAEDYVLLVDDDEALSLRVPVTWDDVANDDWEIDGEVICDVGDRPLCIMDLVQAIEARSTGAFARVVEGTEGDVASRPQQTWMD